MSNKRFPYIVNDALSPASADANEYEFVGDVVNPYVAFAEVLELAEERGIVFGKSAEGDDALLGMYRKKATS